MIIIDAHVHIHECFNLDRLFDAAYKNFCTAGRGGGKDAVFFLMLTESRKQHRFERLRNREDVCRDWRALSTREPISLRLERENDTPRAEMFLVAGRQLVTAERLEVLALLTGGQFEEGLPLSRTVDEVRRRGGLPALPWGAGKWLGQRRRILRRFLAAEAKQPIFLADNRCRPEMWPFPEFARKTTLKILAGTDPLPFSWEERRAGSFGTMLAGGRREIDEDYPAAAVKDLLLDPQNQPEIYGHSEAPMGFLRNQAAMQIYKHLSS